MLYKILAASLLLAVSLTAYAENWTSLVGPHSAVGDHSEYDSTSVRRNGSRVRVWIRTTFAKPQSLSDGVAYDQWLGQYEIDCKFFRVNIIQTYISFHGIDVGGSRKQTGFFALRSDAPITDDAPQICAM